MLNLHPDEFMMELTGGSIKNVGPTNKAAEAKLFDVASTEVHEFGDKRVKLVFKDDGGNEMQVALFPGEARDIARDIEALEEETPVFESSRP